MNYGIVVKVMGYLLLVESALMLLPLFVALHYNQPDVIAFIISILITGIIGIIMSKSFKYRDDIRVKEGLAIVAFGWVLVSLFGSLPFIVSNSVSSWVDGIFETISGFTTTGATIMDNVEVLPKGILFWRSLTQWIGGMGILVFTVALLPILGVGGFQIFKVESPGPSPDRIAPRVRDTAKILYTSYIIMTLAQIILLLVGKMPLYDAIVHSFGTVATGGFSIKNASIGAYNSPYINRVIGIFMVLSGINFSLFYHLYRGRIREFVMDEELRLYLGIMAIAVILLALNIRGRVYNGWVTSLKYSLFHVSSIITTTAYTIVDFNQWPSFSKLILLLLMFIGGCAGSTAGGIKNIRILILSKLVKREFSKIFHPRAIIPIKVNKKIVPDKTIASISGFFMLYMLIFALGSVLISLEGIDIESAMSVSAASLGNIGPAFGLVAPSQTYSQFSQAGKLLLSILMLLGRLELFTVIALFLPSIWRKELLSRNIKNIGFW